ncbi:MAG: co-chaperone GroES [Thiobacillaceae bacterium]
MHIRPLHDRIIVKRVEAERTTASGIVIPDTAAEKPEQGEVIAVGPGRLDERGKRIAPDVKIGDRVLFGKYAGQTVKVEGEELLVLREDDIMAVITPEAGAMKKAA